MKVIPVSNCMDCPSLHLKPFSSDYECLHESFSCRKLIVSKVDVDRWRVDNWVIPDWCPLADSDGINF